MVTLGLGAGFGRAHKGNITPPVDFSPSLNDTLAWYDVGDTGSVDHDANTVTTLDDLSGNDRHIGNTGGNRPTYDSANDKITFDGSNDYLYHSSPFLYALSEKTIYAVLNVTAGNYKCILGEASTSSTSPGYCPLMTGAGGDDDEITPYITTDSSSFLKANTPMNAAFAGTKKIIRLHEKNGLMCAWIDGVLCSAPRSYTRGEALTLNRFALGCRPESGGAFFAGFELYELIITADDAHGREYEGYLAHKHGLTDNLSADHPYKTLHPKMGNATNYEMPLNMEPVTALLFGDSITAMNSAAFSDTHIYQNSGYFVTYNALAGNRMSFPIDYNEGVGGERINQMLDRIDDLDSLVFDVCFFMGGTNDIANGDSFDNIRDEIDDVLNYIAIHLGKPVIILTILPRTHDSDAAARKQRIKDLNDHILNAHGSREGRVISVNLYDNFSDGGDEPVANATLDGLHPTPYGAMLMGQDMAAGLSSYFGAGTVDFTTGNLLTNGLLTSTGGSGSGVSGDIAASYSFTATAGTPVASKDGNDRQVLTSNYTSGGGSDAFTFSQTISSGYANGDTVYAAALLKIEDVANIDKLQLELSLQPDSVQTLWRGVGFGESGYVIAETYDEPGLYLISTPPIEITTGGVTSIVLKLEQQVKDGSTVTSSTVTIHGMGIFKL